jgi:hypothetical protein
LDLLHLLMLLYVNDYFVSFSYFIDYYCFSINVNVNVNTSQDFMCINAVYFMIY